MTIVGKILVTTMMLFFIVTMLLIVIEGWIIPLVRLSQAREIATSYADEYAKIGLMNVTDVETKITNLGFTDVIINRPITPPDWGERYTIEITAEYETSISLLFMTRVEIRTETERYVLYRDEIISGNVRKQ